MADTRKRRLLFTRSLHEAFKLNALRDGHVSPYVRLSPKHFDEFR